MSHDPKPETPFCTVCLVVLALTCHSCVLFGNIKTAEMFDSIGSSTSGWSNVGISLSRSLEKELDDLITWTMTELTSGLGTILKVEKGIGEVLHITGDATESAKTALLAAKANVKPMANASNISLVKQADGKEKRAAPCSGGKCRDSYRDAGKHARHDAQQAQAAETAASKHEQADASEPDLSIDGEEVQFLQLQVASTRMAPGSVPHVIEKRNSHDGFANVDVTAGKVPCAGRLSEKEAAEQDDHIFDPEKVALQMVQLRERMMHRPNPAAIQGMLREEVTKVVESLKAAVAELLKIMKPPLLQIGKWLKSMGSKVDGMLTEFGTVVDKVQKMIDQVMSKVAAGDNAENQAKLLYNVFAIFDSHNDGKITMKEFTDVATLYGLTAVEGLKGDALFQKYNTNKDGILTKDDFSRLVADPDVPQLRTVVLRTFAKRLAVIAGNLGAARKRDEVAHVVAKYLQLMASKNETKVYWISERLTNKSLPDAFVADVLVELAEGKNDPAVFTIIDTGAYVVKHMMALGPAAIGATMEVFAKIKDPMWWAGSGKSPSHQAGIVQLITGWLETANRPAVLQTLANDRSFKASVSLLDDDAEEDGRKVELSELVAQDVERRRIKYAQLLRAREAKRAEDFYASETTCSLSQSLLGTLSGAGQKTKDEDVTRVLETGKMAAPETLQFAHFLAENASHTSHMFNEQCFKHQGTSSNTVDSFATQIVAGIKKIQNFLHLMQQYSTPTGIANLENNIQMFLDHALDEVLHKVGLVLQAQVAMDSTDLRLVSDPPLIEGVFKFIVQITQDLKSALPTVIGDMKFARREVSAVAKTLFTIFGSLHQNGPPIFQKISSLYKTLWIVYFVVFALLTLSLLLYGFWAAGYMGGPEKKIDDEDVPPPVGFMEKCSCCCRACCHCFSSSMYTMQETTLCFWSCILLAEVVVLLMFIVGIVLCLLAGIKLFLKFGCAEVYMLNDAHVCTGMLHTIWTWLHSFWAFMPGVLKDACSHQQLMACKLIVNDIMLNAILTSGGSMLAAACTGQLIFESARLHETAWWTMRMRALDNDDDFAEKSDNEM